MTEKQETENQYEKSVVDNVIEGMKTSFNSPFYTKSDVQAACAVGAVLSYAVYLQETKFETKGLAKVVARLFDHLDRKKLESMMAEASALLFKAETRTDIVVSWKHRAFASELLSKAEWTSRPEELQIAFVHGYDSFNRVRGAKDE